MCTVWSSTRGAVTRAERRDPNGCVHLLHAQAPVAGVVSLGLYLFVRLMLGIGSFKSCPEEEAALHQVRCDICRRCILPLRVASRT